MRRSCANRHVLRSDDFVVVDDDDAQEQRSDVVVCAGKIKLALERVLKRTHERSVTNLMLLCGRATHRNGRRARYFQLLFKLTALVGNHTSMRVQKLRARPRGML